MLAVMRQAISRPSAMAATTSTPPIQRARLWIASAEAAASSLSLFAAQSTRPAVAARSISGCGAGHQVQAGGDGIAIIRCLHRALNLWPGLWAAPPALAGKRSLRRRWRWPGNELCRARFPVGVSCKVLRTAWVCTAPAGVDFVQHALERL